MLTKYLAKVMGLWIVLAVLGLIVTRQTSLTILTALFNDQPLMWVTGVFTMLVGIIVVVIHNRWSGGPLPVLVTLYGWIALIKGLMFLWLPPSAQAAAWQSLHFDRFYYGYLIVALIIGGYLTYGGFATSGPQEVGTWPTVPRPTPKH